MNNPWAFLPMTVSNGLLGDPGALRERMDADGYLLFRRVLDCDSLLELRRQMLAVMADHGWVKRQRVLMRALVARPPVREGDDEFFAVYDDVQRLEAFHALAHHERLLGVVRQVVGGTAFPHPLKIARIGFPGNYEASTPPHQDYLNNQGTPRLTAAWIPLGRVPTELGGVAILRGSHRLGVLPLEFDLGPGNRRAVLSPDVLEELRWVTTDYELGDVLLFPSLTVHAALHNASEVELRLSVDFRYQCEGEDLTEIVLQPHFRRVTWDDIYVGWQSKELQYYWRDLDYRVVPFDRSELEVSEPRDRDLRAYYRYAHRVRLRWDRMRRESTGADEARAR